MDFMVIISVILTVSNAHPLSRSIHRLAVLTPLVSSRARFGSPGKFVPTPSTTAAANTSSTGRCLSHFPTHVVLYNVSFIAFFSFTHNNTVKMMSSRSLSLSFCSLLVVWMIVLSSTSSTTSLLLVRAQEEEVGGGGGGGCDCSSHIETAKQETTNSFQATLDDLNRRLNEAAAAVTGKDGEIAQLSAQVQEVTSSMTAKVNELSSQLAHHVQESEAAKSASQASHRTLEEIKATLKAAQDEAAHAKNQVSKYLNQRFFINMTLLKQDFNNLLKKLGLNKSEEL
jgi:hypothetical protein